MRPFVSAVGIALFLISDAVGADSALVVPQLAKPPVKPVEGDPLQEKYDTAWSRYEESLAAVTTRVNEALQRHYKAAADKGDFYLAKEWKKRMQTFADTKTIEWPTDGKAKTEWRKRFPDADFPEAFSESVESAREGYAAAVRSLKDDYDALVKEYTRREDFDGAERLINEWTALERKPGPPPVPQPVPRPVLVERPKPQPKPWPVAKNGAQQFRGHWYKVFPERLSWHQAKARCEEIGGHLVIVDDAQEEAFVRGLAQKAGFMGAAWLGVTDQGHEGRWVWVDGKQLTYSNWGYLQPNNKDNAEHYAVLRLEKGDWMDLPSAFPEMAIGFVCEWDE